MSNRELEILQIVVMVLIQVAVPSLLAWGIVELKRYVERLEMRGDWDVIEDAVHTAVVAAEQLDLTDQLLEYGEEKLDRSDLSRGSAIGGVGDSV